MDAQERYPDTEMTVHCGRPAQDVREALLECLVKITSAIKETLERTPPELSADIIDHGITPEAAQLRGPRQD